MGMVMRGGESLRSSAIWTMTVGRSANGVSQMFMVLLISQKSDYDMLLCVFKYYGINRKISIDFRYINEILFRKIETILKLIQLFFEFQ